MQWLGITNMVRQHPQFEAILELTQLVDRHAKYLCGPEGVAFAAGGAISDMFGSCTQSRKSEIRDIDVFVTRHDKLPSVLETHAGMTIIHDSSTQYANLDVFNSTWNNLPVQIVQVDDVAQQIHLFDLCDRLAWCDGQRYWITETAAECIRSNEIEINCLCTPVRTAIRIASFKERYSATVTKRAKLLIKNAIGHTPLELRTAVRSHCNDDAHADQVALTFF